MVSVGSLPGDDVDLGRRTGEGRGQTKKESNRNRLFHVERVADGVVVVGLGEGVRAGRIALVCGWNSGPL